MSWQEASDIAQVIMTGLTGVGIVTSVWIGVQSVLEAKKTRIHQSLPRLLFDRGGTTIRCQLKEARGIMGLHAAVSAKYTKDAPPGARSCVPIQDWGRLVNHGNGSAFSVTLIFLCCQMRRGNSTTRVLFDEWKTFPFGLDYNTVPGGHLSPGGTATFRRIPTPIFVDYDGKLEELDVALVLRYADIEGHDYQTIQECHVSVDRTDNEAELTFVFGDELKPEPEWKELGIKGDDGWS